MTHTEKPKIDLLTARERIVLKLIAEELTTAQIATILNISPKTVLSHRGSINKKLHTTNVAGLIRHAIKFKLIK